MTIANVNTWPITVGDGATTDFEISFAPYASDATIEVKTLTIATGVENAKTEGVDYSIVTVTGVQYVRFGTAPPATEKVLIRSVTPSKQAQAYVDGSNFPAAAIEAQLDRMARVSDEIQDILSRAVRVPADENGVVFPAKALWDDKVAVPQADGSWLLIATTDLEALASRVDGIDALSTVARLAAIDAIKADFDGADTIGDAAALLAAVSPGLLAKDTGGAPVTRTLTAGDGLAVTNGDGGSGDPTVAWASNLTALRQWAATFISAPTSIPASTRPVQMTPTGVLEYGPGGTPGGGDLLSAQNLADVAKIGTAKKNLRYWCDTIADLTAFSKASLEDGEQARVTRVVAAGPKRLQTWIWDEASTATVDNVVVRTADEGGTGRWVLKLPDLLTPADGGALYDDPGNGTGTDDLAAAQASANAAASYGVRFAWGAGKQRWNGKFEVPAGLDCIGNPRACEIIDTRASSYTPLIEARAVSGWRLAGAKIITQNSFAANSGYGASQVLVRDGCLDGDVRDMIFEGPTQRCVTVLNSEGIRLPDLRGMGFLNALVRVSSDTVMDTPSIDEADDNPIPVRDIEILRCKGRGTDTWTSSTKVANYGIIVQSLDDAADETSDISIIDCSITRTKLQGINVSGANTYSWEIRGCNTSYVDDENATYASRAGAGLLVQTSDGGPARRGTVTGCTDVGSFVGQFVVGANVSGDDIEQLVWQGNVAVDNIRNGLRLLYVRDTAITGCVYSGATGGGEALTGGNGDGIYVLASDYIKLTDVICNDNAGISIQSDATSSYVTVTGLRAADNGTDAPTLAGTNDLLIDTQGLLKVSGSGIVFDVNSNSNTIVAAIRYQGSIVGYLGTRGASGDLVLYDATAGTYINLTSAIINTNKPLQRDGTQILDTRKIEADLANTANSGDADTDDLIDAIVSIIEHHGLGASS